MIGTMTVQVSLRLSDEVVAWLDQQVREGVAVSRAELVMRALLRERRRVAIDRDVEILRTSDGGDDLAGLEKVASRVSLGDLG